MYLLALSIFCDRVVATPGFLFIYLTTLFQQLRLYIVDPGFLLGGGHEFCASYGDKLP